MYFQGSFQLNKALKAMIEMFEFGGDGSPVREETARGLVDRLDQSLWTGEYSFKVLPLESRILKESWESYMSSQENSGGE